MNAFFSYFLFMVYIPECKQQLRSYGSSMIITRPMLIESAFDFSMIISFIVKPVLQNK